jgi:FtsP/CotA-like multicopper oxidase with cupredoxin domain
MNSKQNQWCLKTLATAILFFALGINPGFAQTAPDNNVTPLDRMLKRITQADREAAAARAAEARAAAALQKTAVTAFAAKPALSGATMNPGGVPDYFGVANWAFSPAPTIDPVTKKLVGGIKKFVDTLPGVGAANANNLGQFIPVAIADTTTYPGSDYYHIGIVDYTQQMHSGLPPTKLRGYMDLAEGADGKAHYLGPLIIAKRDRPVRILATNMLGVGTAGNLFLPVDTTVMGAGMGPLGMMASPMNYTQNRTVLHLHGGATPWISDGTPHQWFTPAGETSPYTEGASFQTVPDMPTPAAGSATYYYTNQQSNRLMFYHDHSYGMTRLNVYAGEAAGYLLTDPIEEDLINQGLLPEEAEGVYRYGIPLIIQDKTFVDTNTLPNTDPTWNWGTTPPTPHQGDLWMPHVYMPNQNPADLSGANAFGRWDYGPWFWPPVTAGSGLVHGPIPDPLMPGRLIPGTPNPSMAMESFLDTPLVNGAAYPVLTVQHQPYRFRILNACNERVLNLQLYYVDPKNPTEVKMVPAVATKGYPATWPTDGRAGGVPDPKTAGPQMIQIGTEGGFLPAPVVLPNQPVNYIYDRRNIVVLNVSDHTLLLGPAERADVIIDFSKVPKNAKIMLYNDAPAPMPAFDPRFDFYTGAPDLTSTGGSPTPRVGYGPNIRTIMLFQVAGAPVKTSFNLTALQAAWPSAYAASQAAPIVPQTTYPPPYQAATDTYSRIQDNSLTYTPVGSVTPVTTPFGPKAIQELFELDYGRMNATLGVELPLTNFNTQTTIPLGYVDPLTETLPNNEVQLWKVTHNGVDTHAVHFHLFNVQLINRVGWDGAVRPPDANELGWKETVRMNPLEDAIVALQPAVPQLPFEIPESVRPLDPTMPTDAPIVVTNPVDGNKITVPNAETNFGWEYVWHCHMLGHEEMDFMRPMKLAGVVAADYVKAYPAPYNLSAIVTSPTQVNLNWFCNCPSGSSHRVERATEYGSFATIATLGDVLSYSDTGVASPGTYRYRVFSFSGADGSLPSNTVTVSMAIPAAPYSLAATAIPLSSNPPSVHLTWDNDAVNETGLHLQRSTSKAFPPATTTTFTVGTGSEAYTDATVAKHATYYYRVCTYNGMGSSAYSNIAAVKTTGQLPSTPTGLAVTGTTQKTISLSWVSGGSSTATRILRSAVGAGGPWSAVKSVPNAITNFTNGGLAKNKTYWYIVQAQNADGYSTSTATVSATTLP